MGQTFSTLTERKEGVHPFSISVANGNGKPSFPQRFFRGPPAIPGVIQDEDSRNEKFGLGDRGMLRFPARNTDKNRILTIEVV